MLLFKAPVIVSILTLSTFLEIRKIQKDDAAKLARIKTFTEHSHLLPYYAEVDKTFTKYFEEYIEKFFPFDTTSCTAIKNEMSRVNAIIDKLDNVYAGLLRKSLTGFARHVNNAAHNVFQDLVFPVTFSKL